MSGQTLKKKKNRLNVENCYSQNHIKADTITLKMLQQIQKYAKITSLKAKFVTEKEPHPQNYLDSHTDFSNVK